MKIKKRIQFALIIIITIYTIKTITATVRPIAGSNNSNNNTTVNARVLKILLATSAYVHRVGRGRGLVFMQCLQMRVCPHTAPLHIIYLYVYTYTCHQFGV